MKIFTLIKSAFIYLAVFTGFITLISVVEKATINNVLPRAELTALVFAAVVYLQNAVHRYALLGFKPTYLVAICDTKIDRVLMIRYRKNSGGVLAYYKLVQGGDIGGNAYDGVKEAIMHRLGISMKDVRYTVNETIALGMCLTKGYITRVSTDRFCLLPKWIGKGFLLSIVSMELSDQNLEKISLDRNVYDYQLISSSQIDAHFKEAGEDKGSDAKPRIYKKAKQHIERYLLRMQNKYTDDTALNDSDMDVVGANTT